MPFDLTGRAALVTGSSRGIGKAIAATLAEAGAAVALHGRTDSEALDDSADKLLERGAHVVTVVGNLEDPANAGPIVDRAMEGLGRLDILVNNAGVVDPVSANDMSVQVWTQTLSVNLTSAFFLAQAAARHMRRGGWGRIVNVSSQAGEVAIPDYLHYGVSKAGLNLMTRQLAVEWAGDGITVNAVAPAFIRTDMAADVFKQRPDLYQDQIARVPKRRMGEVGEVATAVLYLVSPEADYTTGTIIHVDGGYLAL